MDWTNIGIIIVGGSQIGIAFLVLLKNYKNKINIIFSSVSLIFITFSFVSLKINFTIFLYFFCMNSTIIYSKLFNF